jgi:hypothetical protein
MAVTVTANSPAGLEGAAVSVSVDLPPIRGVAGENDAVTPLGRPLTLRLTLVARSRPGYTNETLVLVA